MRARAIILSMVLLVGFTFGFGFTALPVAGDGPPEGMVGVPSDSIESDLPPQTPHGHVAEDLREAGVHASEGADSLELIVTNPGRAEQQYTSGSVMGSGPIAIVFSDHTNSEARDVALPRDVLEEIFGYEPELARGTYEDGEYWTSPIEYDGAYAVFEIPHFSDQTVTFEGEVSISATPAEDADTFEYQMTEGEAVDDIVLEVTGTTSSKDEATSFAEVEDGETIDFDVNGTAATDVEVTFTGLNAFEPDNLVEADESTLTHTTEVRDVVWSPDGEYLLTGGESATIYDSDFNEVTELSETGDVWEVDWGTGGYIAALEDGTLHVYNDDFSHEFSRSVDSVTNRLNDLEFSPDGTRLLVATADPGVRVIDVEENNQVDTLDTSNDGAYTAAWSHDGEWVLTADDRRLRMFSVDIDTDTYTEEWSEDYLSENVGELLFSPDDEHYAVLEGTEYGDNEEVRIYERPFDSKNLKTTLTLGDVPWSGEWVEGNDGGHWLFVGLENGNVQVWDTDSETQVDTLNTASNFVQAVHVNENSILSATVDEDAYLWEGTEPGTENPSVTLGGQTVDYTGVLDDGETHIETVTDLDTGAYTEVVNVEGAVDVYLEWTETTETVDPAITIEGDGTQTIDWSGTLAEGDSLDWSDAVDADVLNHDGQINLTVTASEAYDGPPGMYDLQFSHTAAEDRSIAYDAEIFSERYSIDHTWQTDRDDATITIPWASDRVVQLRDLTVVDNGIELTDPSYAFSGSDLIINIGDVEAGDTANVTAIGSKVAVSGGSIKVTEVTDIGLELDSVIEVIDPEPDFSLDLGETRERTVHIDPNWQGAQPYSQISPSGQELHLPEAVDGGEATLTDTDIYVETTSGFATFEWVDPDDPRFEVTDLDNRLEVTYYDTIGGDRYVLYDVGDNSVVDADIASSPVHLLTGSDGEFRIFQQDSDGSGGGDPVVSTSDGDGLIGPIGFMGLLGLLMVGSVVVGRRFEVPTIGIVLPVVAIGAVGLELVTGTDLIGTAIASVPSAFIAVAIGGASLLGLWGLDQRTEADIPEWLMAVVGGGIILVVLEAVTGGEVTGSIEAIVDNMSAGLGAVAIPMAIVGVLYLIDRRTRLSIPRWFKFGAGGLAALVFLEGALAGGLAAALDTAIAEIALGVILLLGLWLVHSRTRLEVPMWLLILAGAAVSLFMAEAIFPGALSEGLAEVSPAIWIVGLVATAFIIWRRIQPRPIQIGGEEF